jgi:hypothetical protein
MRVIGRFFKVGIVVVALVLCAMMALSAFSIKVPLSSVTTTTVGDTTVTTTCSWLRATPEDWSGCSTTTQINHSK